MFASGWAAASDGGNQIPPVRVRFGSQRPTKEVDQLMRNRIAAIAVGASLIALPAAAQGAQRDTTHRQLTSYEKKYEQVRSKFIKSFSLRKAGRDIVIDGYLTKNGAARKATRGEVNASINRMEGALAPAAPAAAAATTSTYSGSSNSTVMCESGGDYSANTGKGFYGGYPFDSGTWDAYGDSQYAEASDAPPAVQDAAAASVPYDAWPNC